MERRVLLERLLPADTWPGHLERLGRLLAELGGAGIFEGAAPERLLRAAGRAPGPRVREVAAALDRYGALLDAEGLADPERALAAVAAAPPPALDLIVVNGVRFSPLERRVVERLAAAAGRAIFIERPAARTPPGGVRLRRATTRSAEVEAIAAGVRGARYAIGSWKRPGFARQRISPRGSE